MKKPTFIRCPRCELNFIEKKEKYCAVCKQEMKALGNDGIDLDEESELEICPVCRSNYIQEDEIMCANCAKEKALEDGSYNEAEAEADWTNYIEGEEDAILDNEELGEMVNITDDDDSASDDDEDDDEDEEESSESIDDLDDDLDIDLDDLDDDEDDEDDSDENDDEDDD